MDIHIGNKGTEVRFAAGYMNREARRYFARAYRRRPVLAKLMQTVAHKNS